MSNTVITANMLLPVPIVGEEAGPEYAVDINSCMSIIDSHSHTPGYGVQITPDGLNINSNLTFQNNSAIALKSARFTSQTVPIPASLPNLQCVYVSGVDLYYNDGNGNQVRITQSGGVAGSPGSISNLVSPASASYNVGSETFVWESDTNTAADLDARNVILRNATASSNGLTLSPPLAMGSDYTITMPALPVATSFVRMSTSGALTAAVTLDNTTIDLNSNVLRVKPQGITPTQMAAYNLARSASTANYTGGSVATYTTVTNAAVSITVSGLRPVSISAEWDRSNIASIGYIEFSTVTSSLRILSSVDGSVNAISVRADQRISPSAINFIDTPAAGTVTYTLQYISNGGGVAVNSIKLVAYEL